jgi:hypothetical protein
MVFPVALITTGHGRVFVKTRAQPSPAVDPRWRGGDVVGFTGSTQTRHSREACPRESGERESTSFLRDSRSPLAGSYRSCRGLPEAGELVLPPKGKTKPNKANATSCLLSDRCFIKVENKANAIKICAIRWLREKMGEIPENMDGTGEPWLHLKDCDRRLSVV